MRRWLEEIAVEKKLLADYERFGQNVCLETREVAEKLAGRRIVHVNATEKGGGVAELLRSQVALERGLGLAVRWVVIRPSADFFAVTKKIHHLLQGMAGRLEANEEELYKVGSERLASALREYVADDPADLLVVHDPQPLLAASGLLPLKILRLHVDLCRPNAGMMEWLCRKVPAYNQVVVSRQDCTLVCAGDALTTIAPAIDPLTPKNEPLSWVAAKKMVRDFGIDNKRPLITQISRFDLWKDPLGVVAAYRLAKRSIPDLQLALVGFFRADDDADSQEYFRQVEAEVGSDPDIHLFSQAKQLGEVPNDMFINAVQVASDVIIQKSIREGFGLTVTEAMWKSKAVIGGDAGGILLQIESGKNGVLVSGIDEAAAAVVDLISQPARRQQLGAAARVSVQKRFLMPRFVRDNLRVYQQLL